MTRARNDGVVGEISPNVPDLFDAPVYDRRSSARMARERKVFDPLTVPLDPGISLVEASAGTGKTYCITLTVVRLLLEPDTAGKHRTIGSILVVTFTNAATDELITRLRKTLRDAVDVFSGAITEGEKFKPFFSLRDRYGADGLARLREALRSLDQLSVFTIHGFCKRVLEESALESGTPYDATFLEDDALLVERVAQDWWRRTIYENERLAAIAVQQEWKWNAFLKELKSFRRWPDTTLDPDVRLPAAMRGVDEALAAFARAWNRAGAESFLAGLSWRKNAPLADADYRAQILDAAEALAHGDLARGLVVVAECTTAAIRHDKTGIKQQSRAEKAAFAEVPDHPFVRACDDVAAALAPVTLALRVSCIRDVERDFRREKQRRHLLGFDDLLERLCTAITAEGPDGQLAKAIRRRYDAALIDEFQDTDPYQFPIFSTAFAGRPLFLIGDPKQAIYGFRGADIFAYMRAAEQAGEQYTLRHNWRSTRQLVDAVNALFTRRPDPFLFPGIPYLTVDAAKDPASPLVDDKRAMHWWFLPTADGKPLGKTAAQEQIHDAICREVVALLGMKDASGQPVKDEKGKPFTPGRIAVLVRGGYEAAAIQRMLRQANVPSIIAGMGDILQSREMLELECVMRAVVRPHHAPTVRAALATEMWGWDAAAIHRLSLPEQEGDWQTLVDELVQARDTWARYGFMRMAQEFVSRHGVAARLLAYADGERRLTNLRHAVELLHATAIEERFSAEALLLWIARSRARGDQDAERTELRLESDADAVQIVTIHKSKGLEYDVVFCPSLWLPWITPEDAPVAVHEGDAVVFDHGSPRRAERGRLANAERLAEELRLAYVALTRARFRTYVAWGAIAKSGSAEAAWASALGYLLRDSEADGSEADVAEQVARDEQASVEGWWPRLEAFVRANADVMSATQIGWSDAPPARWAGMGQSVTEPAVRERVPAPLQLESWRIASFTSLTRDRHVEDARDLADGESHEPAAEAAPLPRSDFMSFPAGRHAGIALHEIFEKLDFVGPASDVDATVADVLQRHRFALDESDPRITATIAMVNRVLRSTLPAADFPLRQVPKGKTLREWKFHLPLGAVERHTLADLFAAHGDGVAQRYAPVLRAISPQRTFGFLTGVVDLAFEQHGRWHVVDWKSNHLGTDLGNYEPDALEPEMFGNHYVLQYHLYVTALHRFLRMRVPGYRYGTHMGDVWYAFLRGIDGSARGWHHHRPAEALIVALDALMGAGGTA